MGDRARREHRGPASGPRRRDDLGLGPGGLWDYGRDDLVSPLQAATAGAFAARGDEPEAHLGTELRIHGVGGSQPQDMLGHPHVLQVGGDDTTMFHRRWNPSGDARPTVPWRLESYSWGGLTQSGLASALWLLLFPFMLYNLAHFALPAGSRGPSRTAEALIRLLALVATAQFVLTPLVILVNGFAFQASSLTLPVWAKGWGGFLLLDRIGWAAAATAAIVLIVWLGSMVTARRYERRVATDRPAVARARGMASGNFWCGYENVRRQRSLHTAVALAVVALAVTRPGTDSGGLGRLVVQIVSGLVIAVAVVASLSSWTDRFQLPVTSGKEAAPPATRAVRVLLAVAIAGVPAAVLTSWRANEEPPAGGDTTLPGLSSIGWAVLVVQVVLIALIAVVVWATRRPAATEDGGRSGPESRQTRGPFARGHLTTVLLVLATGFGGMLTLATSVFVLRLVSTPTAVRVMVMGPSLQIPTPVYVFALVPIGVTASFFVAAGLLGLRWRRDTAVFNNRRSTSPIGELYADPRADDADRSRHRRSIARAWAVGLFVDSAGATAVLVALGVAAGVGAGIVADRLGEFQSVKTHGLTGLSSVLVVGFGALFVWLLRADLSGSARRAVGTVWDVATFWPRASHPLAPPCYAERAVPEVVDRVRLLTGYVGVAADDPVFAHAQNDDAPDYPSPASLRVPTGPVLLTGYSQGSIIAPAVLLQLPQEVTGGVSLLTLACPLRRLYGRAFPAYLGPEEIDAMKEQLGREKGGTIRWKNLVRRTDYIGSWVDRPLHLPPPGRRASITDHIDQVSYDPAVVSPDVDQAPPPIHRHSDFWADPRVIPLGRHLLEALSDRERAVSSSTRLVRPPSTASESRPTPDFRPVVALFLCLTAAILRRRSS